MVGNPDFLKPSPGLLEARFFGRLNNRIGACRGCPFLNSVECPKFPKINFLNPGKVVCSKFKDLSNLVKSEGYSSLVAQTQFFELLKAKMVKDFLFQKWQSNPELGVPKGLMDWTVLVNNVLADIRKQEDGSKISVKREITPSDVLGVVRRMEADDVTFEIVDKK